PIGAQGAHVGGCGPDWNGRSFGVSLVGGVDHCGDPVFNMTHAQMITLERGIRRFLALHPHGPGEVTILGHRDLIAQTQAPVKKACPCFDVPQWWAERLAFTGAPSHS
ncbi:MAG: lysozyme, partial [Pseudomonadota bacterium]